MSFFSGFPPDLLLRFLSGFVVVPPICCFFGLFLFLYLSHFLVLVFSILLQFLIFMFIYHVLCFLFFNCLSFFVQFFFLMFFLVFGFSCCVLFFSFHFPFK